MNTDVVEIFQTLRACLQPYTNRGYATHKNSETEYDLWSEKNSLDGDEKVTERFFASLEIHQNVVIVKTSAKHVDASLEDASTLKVENLTDEKRKEVENLIAISHNYFKEKEWI